MAEQLELQRALRNAGAAQGDEGLIRSRGPGVDCPGEPLLAASGLAADEDRGLGACHLTGAPEERLHRRAPRARVRAASAPQLLLEQLGVGVILEVEPLEGDGLARALDGDGQQLRVHLDQVHHRRRVNLAHRAVQGEDAQRLLAGNQRRNEARVTGREIQHVIERVPVSVPVIGLEKGARSPGLEGLAQGRELIEGERVLANPVVGEGATGGAHHQPFLLEHEDGRQIVRGDARQPVESAAEDVIHRLLRSHQRRELLEVAREIHRAERRCGSHGRDSNDRSTEVPVFSPPLSTVDVPKSR